MSYANIKTALGEILEELVGVGQPFQVLYKNFEAEITEFPALLYRSIDSDGEKRFDSESNEAYMRFLIRAVLRYENSEAAEDTLLGILDDVADKLRETDNRDTLAGAVHRLDVEGWRRWESEDSTQPVYGFDIVVNLAKLEP